MPDSARQKLVESKMAEVCTLSENISGEHWRYCLQCGHELINEKCKLRCPRCIRFKLCSATDAQ